MMPIASGTFLSFHLQGVCIYQNFFVTSVLSHSHGNGFDCPKLFHLCYSAAGRH
jgi:hypothetical protein